MTATSLNPEIEFGSWRMQADVTTEAIEEYLMKKQREFRKFKLNIWQLNHSALRIQHWFFKLMLTRKIAKKDEEQALQQCSAKLEKKVLIPSK